MSKESNAIRRWRQGRITFQKLKSLVMRYRHEARGAVQTEVAVGEGDVVELPDLEVEEHEHGDNCTHH